MKPFIKMIDELHAYPKYVMKAGLRAAVLLLLCAFAGYVWGYRYSFHTMYSAIALAQNALSIMSLSIILSLISNYILIRGKSQ